MADLIDRQALKAIYSGKRWRYLRNRINKLPAVDAVEVNAAELKHLINDTIAYIWRLEDRGADKPEFGYDSRKALLEKLQQFEKEHFPDMGCSNG